MVTQPQLPVGYIAYELHDVSGVRPTESLRRAALALCMVTAAASALLAYSMMSRSDELDDFGNGGGGLGLSRLQNADDLVALAYIVQIALFFATATAVGMWSRRIVLNASARGVKNLKPGLAMGAWFIPVGFIWLGFNQLYEAVVGLRRTAARMRHWQAAFVLAISSWFMIPYVALAPNRETRDQVIRRFEGQALVAVISAILFVLCAGLAIRGTKEVDRAVTADAA